MKLSSILSLRPTTARYISTGVAALGALAVATQANAADIYAPGPVAYKDVPVVLAPTWTGFYGGANAGWVNSRNGLNTVATPTPDAALGVPAGVSEGLAALSTGTVPVGNKNGFIGGGQIGYNYQFNRFVTGIEADIQGISGSSGTGSVTTSAVVVGVPVTSTQTGTMDTKYLGTVRGRLGFLATPTLLVYGTGGLAYGSVSASSSLFQSVTPTHFGTGSGAFSDTRTGWAAGGGLEWMFAQNWSAKVEYLHDDLGTGSFARSATTAFFLTPVYQTARFSAHFEGDSVRAGLNYHVLPAYEPLK
jgi:outer membrane immunogenic protein